MDADDLTVDQLRAANAELQRANVLLARRRFGKADSAAASLLAKLEAERDELEARLGKLEPLDPVAAERRALIGRVEELHGQVLAQQQQLHEITATRTWRLAARYWAMRDRVKGAFERGSGGQSQQ